VTLLRDLWDLVPPTMRGALVVVLGAVFILWVRTQTINNCVRVLEAQRVLHSEHLAHCQDVISDLRDELEECQDDQSTEIGGAGEWREGDQPR